MRSGPRPVSSTPPRAPWPHRPRPAASRLGLGLGLGLGLALGLGLGLGFILGLGLPRALHVRIALGEPLRLGCSGLQPEHTGPARRGKHGSHRVTQGPGCGAAGLRGRGAASRLLLGRVVRRLRLPHLDAALLVRLRFRVRVSWLANPNPKPNPNPNISTRLSSAALRPRGGRPPGQG